MESQDKIEFKITKDSENEDVHLHGMSLQAAAAFERLLSCALSIIQSSIKSPDLKVSIRKGSAMIVTEGARKEIIQIRRQFTNVLEKKASSETLIQSWRDLQKLIKLNGLTYELNFYIANEKEAVVETLKSSRKISKKRQFVKAESNVEFVQGRLMQAGGKKPNIHIDEVNGGKLTVSCTEQSARKANNFLYDTIYASVWKMRKGDDIYYELCDSYFPKDMEYYKRFQEFIELYRQLAIVPALKKLHYECRWYLDKKDYGHLRKFLKLFIHEKADINVLKTLLILLEPFGENERIGPSIKHIQELFARKLTAIQKKKNG